MEKWNELPTWQKIAIGALLIAAAFVMPELMFFYDIGGMELMFGFFVMYLQSIKAYVHSKITAIKESIEILVISLSSTIANDRKVFSIQVAFCITAFLLTGSVYLSSLFVMPGFLLTGPAFT